MGEWGDRPFGFLMALIEEFTMGTSQAIFKWSQESDQYRSRSELEKIWKPFRALPKLK